MSLDAWTPLESVDDDLLTLESAALLSLAAKHGMRKLEEAAEEWRMVQQGLFFDIDEPGRFERPIAALRNLLQLSGLMLPSAVERARLPSFGAALREMSSIVDRKQGEANDVRAALALLNLACAGSLVDRGDVATVVNSGRLVSAWTNILDFALLLVTEPDSLPAPELSRPVDGAWIAHDRSLVGDYTPWTLGIGPMFHSLAGWDSTWLMGRGTGKGAYAPSYWTPLPHLVLGPLGWSDPAVGVARWILQGMPRETPQLSLLAQVWGFDALMYFSQDDWIPQSSGVSGLKFERSGLKLRQIYKESQSAAEYQRCGGLHIQQHLMWQMFGVGSPQPGGVGVYTHRGNHQTQKFVLDLGGMAGWRSQLQLEGEKLWAEFPDQQLDVTVLAAPVGNLGTFRRSPTTELWYSGSHEAHLLGYSQSSAAHRRSFNWPAGEEYLPLNTSHRTAAAFWLASELARRHPHCVLYGDGPESGSGLRLSSSSAPTIHISRNAVYRVEGMKSAMAARVHETHDQRELIRGIEREVGLPVQSKSGATTARTVVYRVMAQVLAVVAGEKTRWDIASVGQTANGSVWELSRDGESLATFLPDGRVVSSKGTVNLLERYNAHSRRLTATVGEVFGHILP